MRVGARNRIVGRVTRIDKGKVMGLVKLEVTGPHMMASALTVESLKKRWGSERATRWRSSLRP